jgi:thiosulfate/3-mercaptopyruvate sulfurtransferase
VAKALARGAIAWDVRGAERFSDGHLPGAVNIGEVSAALVDEKTPQFRPIEVIAKRLGEGGIDLKREIVVYGAAGSANAYFAQFALEYFGATRVHVFHDGLDGWKAARKPVSTTASPRKSVKVRPFANPALLVTTGEVLARVGSPQVLFVDVRRAAEFSGEEIAEGTRPGHIPGAINIPYESQMVDLRLRKAASLRALYADLDRRREIVVYCQNGLRAAMTASVLARLGFRSVRLYQGSWQEYGALPEAPVEP